ncbi:hypothetical protein SDRG_07845 [Saprolegnia diclina VS20]|uniref:Uncharacterized protein n=1 Tax=Saprolegnia diclina (strain VS20) TaxID=1156394 RepID=T0RW41_SAPDV|nr:hypothetical protein SDRG_07845 [Saprolegnia diclina VS20]EQC34517.1 hypothetical protein SDRG_07845 [Saprolegnia diclina VS20]|eukprot:XP_008611923.1 hypothetical protein SDRG_07845 [Saprolegnia diclina VS20]
MDNDRKMTPEEKVRADEKMGVDDNDDETLSPEELARRGAVGRRNGVSGIKLPEEVSNNAGH